MAIKLYIKGKRITTNTSNIQIWCCGDCSQYPHILIFLSSPPNNIEAFFMFPQAKNSKRARRKALLLKLV